MINNMRKTMPTVKDVIMETGDFMIFISGMLLNGTYGTLSDLEAQYACKMAEIIPIFEELHEIYTAKPPCKIYDIKSGEQIG